MYQSLSIRQEEAAPYPKASHRAAQAYGRWKGQLPYGQFLGYRKGEDGLPEIVESETVRSIPAFHEGKTPSTIAKLLKTKGIRRAARNGKLQR